MKDEFKAFRMLPFEWNSGKARKRSLSLCPKSPGNSGKSFNIRSRRFLGIKWPRLQRFSFCEEDIHEGWDEVAGVRGRFDRKDLFFNHNSLQISGIGMRHSARINQFCDSIDGFVTGSSTMEEGGVTILQVIRDRCFQKTSSWYRSDWRPNNVSL